MKKFLEKEIVIKTTHKALLIESVVAGLLWTYILYEMLSLGNELFIPFLEAANKVGIFKTTMIMCPIVIIVTALLIYGDMLIRSGNTQNVESTNKKVTKRRTKKTK